MVRILVDGQELDESRLNDLRQHIAWVDPAVQLWNKIFAREPALRLPSNAAVEEVIEAAEKLQRVSGTASGRLDTAPRRRRRTSVGRRRSASAIGVLCCVQMCGW